MVQIYLPVPRSVKDNVFSSSLPTDAVSFPRFFASDNACGQKNRASMFSSDSASINAPYEREAMCCAHRSGGSLRRLGTGLIGNSGMAGGDDADYSWMDAQSRHSLELHRSQSNVNQPPRCFLLNHSLRYLIRFPRRRPSILHVADPTLQAAATGS
jgi:hypothetical protein